ncbi:MAG TPA: S24/S26 family peptidase [Terriglobales bacterium]|jgi:hypothetical protein|nr:S24/S26 family peptidase [Terriglobales bacterium]
MSVRDRWNAQRDALAVEVLRGGGCLRLHVHGESMLPTLWPGDFAEIEDCSLHDVGAGDLVLATRDGRLYLHRLMTHAGDRTFVTRGDSMPGADPVFESDALLGKLVSASRAGTPVSVALRPWSRVLGLLFCYCSFARRVALRLRKSTDSQKLHGIDLETA